MPYSFAFILSSSSCCFLAFASSTLRVAGSSKSIPACLARCLSSYSGMSWAALSWLTLSPFCISFCSSSVYSSPLSNMRPNVCSSFSRCSRSSPLCLRKLSLIVMSSGANLCAASRSLTAISRVVLVSSATRASARRYKAFTFLGFSSSAWLLAYTASYGFRILIMHCAMLVKATPRTSSTFCRSSGSNFSSSRSSQIISCLSILLNRR
mmetsp:Transcript_30954/g.42902  ORF Transcript_30954/g.42902 Transcript_30954/m.42902 type:complete len:209 (+) Transcript_30954:611-1237(+)